MAQETHRRRSAAAAAGAPPPPDPSTPCAIVECLGSCPPLSPPDLGVVHHGEDGCGVEEVPFCSYLRRLTPSHAAPPSASGQGRARAAPPLCARRGMTYLTLSASMLSSHCQYSSQV
jgi:hypothetical protein